MRLPKDMNPDKWSMNEYLHLFRLIERQVKGNGINCRISAQVLTITSVLDLAALVDDANSGFRMGGEHTFHVQFPFILNTKDIREGEEVVLLDEMDVTKKNKKKRRKLNAPMNN